jgi:proteasome lid subunit RPN8/RPN11
VAPGDYLRAEREADSRGLILLGFYHSHPDHPASPSETDRRFAQPGFSYPIVSVTADGVAEVRSWRVRDAWYEEERVRRAPETSATSNTSND